MLRELTVWWVQQMASLLPQGLRGGGRMRDALVVRAESGALQASLRRKGVERTLGALQPGNPALRRIKGRSATPVLLALPPSAMLQQTATLPLAAEIDLAAVLRNEMDRLTPFSAEEVYWAWRTERRDRE